jgi:hypothetical protein
MNSVITVLIIGCLLGLPMPAGVQPAKLETLTSIDHLYEVLAKDEVSYIYFGRPTCPDCQEFLPILVGAMLDNSQDVYYFNTDDRREDEEYDEILHIFGVSWVPALYKVQSNTILEEFLLQFSRGADEGALNECKNELKLFFSNSENEGS